MKRSHLYLLTAAIAATLVLSAFSSCEVGLGDSVDTEAPTIDITYPPSAAIIRGTFTLAGTCGDDKGISSIAGTIRNVSTGATTSFSTGTTDNSTWSQSINSYDAAAYAATNGWQFPDGKYEISVVATDGAGHTSGTSSHTYEIDNTAPVFIMSNPGATAISNPTTYGTTFQVSGTVAEDHTVSSINVSVYSKDKALIGTYSSENVNTAGGTSVVLAKYAQNGTDALNTNYTTIYNGSSNAGNDGGNAKTHAYYCTIALSDNAHVYTNSSADTTTGNTTSVCYLYDSVYDTFESSKNGGYGLDADALKKIINGTYSQSSDAGNYTSTQQAEIKTAFLAKGTNTDITATPSAFSLNPDANPTYAINGFSFSGTAINSSSAKGNTMTLVANAGRDNTPISTTTTLYIFGPYRLSSANPGSETVLTTAIADAIYSDPDSFATNNSDKQILKQSLTSASSKTSQSYTFKVPDTVTTQKYYVIAASGADTNGSKLTNGGNYYGFSVAATGISPTLTIDSPDNNAIIKAVDTPLTVSGTVSTSDEAGIASVTYSVDITGSGETPSTIKGNAPISGNTWTMSLPIQITNVKQYLITMTATGNNGVTITKDRTITIDGTTPTAKINSVTPIVEPDTVNGTITVNCSASATNLSTVQLTVTGTKADGTPNWSITPTNTGTNNSAVYAIGTTQFKDKTPITLTFTATDKVNHTGTAQQTLTVNQASDAPELALTNADKLMTDVTSITSTPGANAYGNLFAISTNNKILGSVSDDDGIAQIQIYTKLASADDTQYAEDTTHEPGTLTLQPTTYQLSYQLPTTEGEYSVKIIITDKLNETGYYKTTNAFVLAVDVGAPVFSAVTPASGNFYSTTPIAVSGTITDASGSVIITPSDASTGASSITGTITGTKNGTGWNDTVTISSLTTGAYTKIYTAKDKYGQTSTYEIKYSIDKDAPALSNIQPPNNTYIKKENTVSVSGNAADAGSSGVSSVWYKVQTATADAPSFSGETGWTQASVNVPSWLANIDLSNNTTYPEGAYKVWLAAKDNAGNRSTPTAITLYADAAAPVFTTTGYPTQYVKQGFTVTGTITETYLDTATALTWSRTGTSPDSGAATLTGTGPYTFSIDQTSLGQGTYTYTLTAADKAGHTTTSTFTTSFDTTAPTTNTIDAPSSDDAATGVNSLTGTSYIFRGTAKDNEGGAGLANISYKFDSGSYTELPLSDGSWSITRALAAGTSGGAADTLYEGSHTLTVKAKDKAGNETAEYTRSFSVDMNAPTLTETAVNTTNTVNRNVLFTLVLSAGDTNSLSSVTLTQQKGSGTAKTITLNSASGTSFAQTVANLPRDPSNTANAATITNGAADDLYTYTVTATDAAGRTTTIARTVRFDTVGPVITVDNLTDGQWIAASSYTVKGLVTDASTSVASFKYSADGGSSWTTVTGTSWNFSLSSLTEQPYTLRFKASDAAGNESLYPASGDVTFKVDLHDPTLTDGSSVGTITNTGFTLTGTVSDTYLATVVISNSVTSRTWDVKPASGSTTWTQAFVTGSVNSSQENYIADGNYTFTVTAKDESGRAKTITRTLTVDTTAPELSSITWEAAAGNVIFTDINTDYSVSGNVSDATSGVEGVYYALTTSSTAPATTAASTWTKMNGTGYWSGNIPLTSCTDATYYLHIFARDNAGVDSTPQSRSFTADTAAPTVTITAPASPALYNDSFSVTGTTTGADAVSNQVTAAIRYGSLSGIDNSPAVTGTDPFTCTIPVASLTTHNDGSYTVTVTATDKHGRTGTGTYTFTRDTTGPDITVTNLESNQTITSLSDGKYTVRGTWSDNLSGTSGGSAALAYRVGTTGDYTPVSAFPVAVPFSQGLGQTVSFSAKDNLGNETIKTFTGVNVDTDPPSLTVTSPASSVQVYNKNGSTFTLSGTAQDAVSLNTVTVIATKNGTRVKADGTADAGGVWYTYTADSPKTAEKSWSKTLTGTAANDGTWVFTVTAEDTSGQKSSSQTRTVIMDATSPAVTLTAASVPTVTETENASFRFSGTATDAGSGVTKVEMTFDTASGTIYTVSGTDSWNQTVVFANDTLFSTQGAKTLYARATDAAGNVGSWVSRSFVYDTAAPAVTAAAYATASSSTPISALNGSFVLKGTASDGYGIDFTAADSLTIIQTASTINSGSPVTVSTSGITRAADWSLTGLPRKADATSFSSLPDSGTYTYTVTVKDKAGKTKTSGSVTVVVDTASPTTNSITAPSSDTAAQGENSLAGSSYIFRGTAKDNDNGIGLAKISYKFDNGSTTDLAMTDGAWSITKELASGTTGAAGPLYEGSHTMTVQATDKAGNVSTTASRSFSVDMSAPTLTETGISSVDTVNKKAAFSLILSAADTNSLSSVTLTQKKGNGTAQTVSLKSASGTSFSQTVENLPRDPSNTANAAVTTDGAADDLYTYTITATDAAGKKTTLIRTVRFDTVGPELSVKIPSQGESIATPLTMQFSAPDSGSGLNSITYTLSKNGTAIATDTQTTLTGNTGKSAALDFTASGYGEGTYTLSATAKDVLGNGTTVNAITFYYDKAAPELEETTVGTSGLTTKANFTLSGTALDTNALKATGKVTITDSASSGATPFTTVTLDGTGIEYTSGEKISWSQQYTIDTANHTNDGTHTFTITATDVAGKTTPITRVVKVDTTAPQFGTGTYQNDTTEFAPYITTAASYTNGSKNWYNTAVLNGIKAYASDAVGGISSLEYALFATVPDTPALNSASWAAFTKSAGTSAKWVGSAKIPLNEGINYIYIRATDGADNVTIYSNSFTAYLDTTAPVIADTPNVTVKVGSGTAVDAASLANATQLVNGKSDVTVTVPVAETGSGLAASGGVQWKIGTNGTLSSAGVTLSGTTATITIPAASLASGTLYVKMTDNTAHTTTASAGFQFLLDTTAPTITVNTPTAGATVNKTISIAGTAVDNQSLEGHIALYVETAAGTYTPFTGMLSSSTSAISGGAWSFSVDTTDTTNVAIYDSDSAAAGMQVHFQLRASDTAGNEQQKGLTLTVDQNSDRPIIALTNIKSSGTLLKTKTVYGTVTDDDGALTGLWYTTDATRADNAVSDPATYAPTVAAPNDWKTITVTSNAWSTDSLASDGSTTWYFYAIDAKGAPFSTRATSSELLRPYITYTDISKQDNTAGVTFAVDTTAPEIRTMTLSQAATSASPASAGDYYSAHSGDDSWFSTNNTAFGGTKGVLYAKVVVYEMNGMTATASDAAKMNLGTSVPASLVATDTTNHTFTYVVGPLNVTTKTGSNNDFADGTVSLTVTVTDAAGTTNQKSMNIVIDNTAPSATVTYPGTALTDAATKAVNMTGTVADNAGGSGIDTLNYVIPLYNTTYTASSTGWSDNLLASSAASWSIAFSKENLDTYKSTTTYATTETGLDTHIFKIPVYFLATDKLGNSTVDTSHYLYYDSDAGKPKAEILSPANGKTVGGVVSIYGAATDIDGSIAKVEVQLDVDTAAGSTPDFGDSDYTTLNGWSVSGLTAKTASDPWYILASGTNNWKVSFDTANMTADSKLSIRVRAVDNEGNTRAWTDAVTVTVDKNVPVIGSPTALSIIEKKTDGTVLVSRDYSSNMYISCKDVDADTKWYLVGSCSDDSGIYSVKLETQAGGTITFTASDADAGFTKTSVKQWSFVIPISNLTNTSTGNISSILKVTDNATPTQNTTTLDIKIKIDTKAPGMYLRSGTSVSNNDTTTTTTTDNLRLVSGGTSSTATIGDGNPVMNSNKVFTLGDTFVEDGSGLQYIAFYFERYVSGGTSRVYCPAYDTKFTADTRRTDLSGSKGTIGAVYVNTDGLAVKYAEDKTGTGGTVRSSEDSFTSDVIKGNHSIRIGGLIKIGGVYSRIATVDYTNGKVTFAPTASTSFTSAEFVYAQVVDHYLTEGPTGTDYTIVQNDDKDGMIESLSNPGNSYPWSATIFSDTIPDGPIQIHVVAIDNAGNVSSGYCTTSVQNSRPRLARILVGTDLNHSGTADYNAAQSLEYAENNGGLADGQAFGEFLYYSTLSGGIAQSEITVNSAKSAKVIKIKNNLYVVPEFTGTINNGLGALYTIGATETDAAKKALAAKTDAFTSCMIKKTDAGTYLNNKGTKEIAAEMNDYGFVYLANSAFTAESSSDTDYKYVALTFWDKTEETTQGYDSQYALLKIPVLVDVVDNTPPTAHITPFYWKNASDNSLYGNSTANGHIELEGDLPTEKFTTGNADAELDRDPKVSGKIRITGEAYDESLLNALYLSITDMAVGGTAGNSTKLAWYDTTAAAWKYLSTPSADTDAGWAALFNTNGWTFRVTDTDGPVQTGHKVTWELDIDTAKTTIFSAITGTNKSAAITAYDTNTNANSGLGNKSAASTDQTTTANPTSYYRMDVVPYITGVTTGLDKAYASKPSVFNRSAKGYYPVRRGETITVKGFNLNGSSTGVTVNGSATDLTVGASGTNATVTLGTTTGTSVKTGALQVSVNSVVSLNNSNKNDAKGSYGTDATYANSYNREPNSTNNMLLTDDRYLYVWNFNTVVTSNVIRYPTMRIGKDSNQTICFTYDKGASNVYMNKAGTDIYIGNSYTQWYDTVTAINSNGDVFGGSQNGDCASAGSNNYSAYARYYFFDRITNASSTIWAYNNGNSQAFSWENCYNGTTYNSNRVKNPKMTVKYNSGTDSVYATYYDSTDDLIKFRYGTVAGDGTVTNSIGDYTTGTKGSATGYVVIAGAGATGTSATLGSTNATKAGEYAAVGVSGSTAIIAWYDAADQQLMYSYNTAPASSAATDIAQWGTHTIVIDSDFAGWYPDMIVDPAGGIHIAYYSAGSGDLKYAYLSSYSSTTPVVSTVDSYLSCGTNISIDYRKVTSGSNTYYVPYISYYMSSFTQTGYSLRTAWLGDTSLIGTAANGTVNDAFTGNWECMTVPVDAAASGIPLDYNVGIGMKQNNSDADAPTLGFGTKKGLVVAQLQ